MDASQISSLTRDSARGRTQYEVNTIGMTRREAEVRRTDATVQIVENRIRSAQQIVESFNLGYSHSLRASIKEARRKARCITLPLGHHGSELSSEQLMQDAYLYQNEIIPTLMDYTGSGFDFKEEFD